MTGDVPGTEMAMGPMALLPHRGPNLALSVGALPSLLRRDQNRLPELVPRLNNPAVRFLRPPDAMRAFHGEVLLLCCDARSGVAPAGRGSTAHPAMGTTSATCQGTQSFRQL